MGAPRESNVIARYLPDPSLRYAKIPFAGPGSFRLTVLVIGFLSGLSLFAWPLIRQATLSEFSFWTLLAIAGVPICLELFLPLRDALLELCNSLRHCWMFRPLDLGLERAVPQPGTSLRYEVHLAARRKVSLEAVHVRLVFWESWRAKGRLRFLRVPRRVIEKQGHDLVRHELGPLEVPKGQHAVIRGSIRVPDVRPTEHHRGKPNHISYVNVTISLVSDPRAPHTKRGNCPRLVTFPWM